MSKKNQPTTGNVRYLWEALFSLYLGYLVIVVVTAESSTVDSAFTRLDFHINAFLHIRQTDFVIPYWALWVPAVAVALLIWLVLRVSARTRFTQGLLRSVAGIIIIVAPLTCCIYGALRFPDGMRWPRGWLQALSPVEMAAAVICALRFLSGRWKRPFWVAVLLLAAHYRFWFYFGVFGHPFNYLYLPANFSVPLNFCAAVTWVAYVRRLGQPETMAVT